jgi:hypothetical protein
MSDGIRDTSRKRQRRLSPGRRAGSVSDGSGPPGLARSRKPHDQRAGIGRRFSFSFRPDPKSAPDPPYPPAPRGRNLLTIKPLIRSVPRPGGEPGWPGGGGPGVGRPSLTLPARITDSVVDHASGSYSGDRRSRFRLVRWEIGPGLSSPDGRKGPQDRLWRDFGGGDDRFELRVVENRSCAKFGRFTGCAGPGSKKARPGVDCRVPGVVRGDSCPLGSRLRPLACPW